MNAASQAFKKLWAGVRRRQLAQKRKAGKHKCQWKRSGTIRRVTSANGDKILKRPKVMGIFYECKLCGETKLEEA